MFCLPVEGIVRNIPFRLDSYFYAEEIAKEKAEAEFQYPFRLDSYFYTMVATDIWREHVSIPFQVRFLFLQKAMKKINNFLGVSIPFQVRFLFLHLAPQVINMRILFQYPFRLDSYFYAYLFKASIYAVFRGHFQKPSDLLIHTW